MRFPRIVQRIRLKQVRDGRVRFRVDRVNKPVDVFHAVKPFYRGADREILSVLCVNAQNQPTCFSLITVGSLNTTRSHPIDIFKVAILSNAYGIVLIHNHPSGSLEPSEEDIEFTGAIRKACELLGIECLDHLIITDDGFTSLRERGLI